MDRIGVIGLGRMGAAMALRFAAQSVPVTGWTRSGRAVDGVATAPDLATLVAASDTLILSLFDDAAVGAMLDALAGHDLSGKLIIETSTIAPSTLKSRAAALAGRGAMLADAPVSGGPELVAAGACGIFIGADPGTAARAEQALAPLSTRMFHVGGLGTGLAMKTVNNALLQTYFAGLVEQMQVAKRAGLDLETALTILCGGPAGVPMVRDRLPKILGRDPAVGFTVAGIAKDNAVFQRVAGELGVAVPTLRAAEAMIADGMAAGLEGADPAALIARAYRDA